MKRYTKILLIFLNFCLNICYLEKNVINWKKTYINSHIYSKTYVFGALSLKLENGFSVKFAYQNLSISLTNRICKLLGYDDFHSFTLMGYQEKKSQMISFLLNRKDHQIYL